MARQSFEVRKEFSRAGFRLALLRRAALGAFLLGSLLLAAQARAAAPCCNITAIDARTGLVTARVNATGQTFQFAVKDARLLRSLKVGQGVYGNFAAKQVSLDGRAACCAIVNVRATPIAAPPVQPTPTPQSKKTAEQKPTTQQSLTSSTGKVNTGSSNINPSEPTTENAIRGATASPGAPRPAVPCCGITAIDARTGLVTVRVNATGQVFQFAVKDAPLLMSLKVGQGIYANFAAKQVSLDGRTACCAIASMGAATAPAAPPISRPAIAPAAPAPAPPSGAPQAAPQKAPATLSGAQQAVPQQAPGLAAEVARTEVRTTYTLPTVSYGTPALVPQRGTAGQLRGGMSAMRRSSVNSNVVHLNGIEGIEQARGLPEGAKNLLLIHAMTLPPEEADHYIVNEKLAAEWIRTHPVPASVKPPDDENRKKKKKKKCDLTHSEGCAQAAQEGAQHVADEAARQMEKLRQQAEDEWKHVSRELTHDWHMAEDCFADKRLDLPDIPVQFSIPIQLPLSFEEGGSHGSASGQVKGTVTIGLPVAADFKAGLTMFYIPCLPFAVRPRSLGADGNLALGTNLGATLNATGGFSKSFRIPPGGGPHFPIQIIPIVIAGVPVAEMDVSIYIDGTVDVDGDGKLDAHFKLNAPHETAFAFECNGKGCRGNARRVSQPVTTSEDAKVTGLVHVKPKFYAALQLDFDYDALSARAGPEPYLLGELYGCGAAAATQSTAGATTTQASYALTADLDWGLDLRAEALVGGKQVGNTFRTSLLPKNPPPHLKFWDLAGSTALVPRLEGTLQPSAGHPASFRTKMPDCYPYSDPVEYRVNWTGGATATSASAGTASASSKMSRGAPAVLLASKAQPASNSTSSACTLQAGQIDCWSEPLKDVSLDLVWPEAGAYSLSVTAVRDKHGRVFPVRATQIDVNVQQGPSGTSGPGGNNP